jgi:hypothetical protein
MHLTYRSAIAVEPTYLIDTFESNQHVEDSLCLLPKANSLTIRPRLNWIFRITLVSRGDMARPIAPIIYQLTSSGSSESGADGGP